MTKEKNKQECEIKLTRHSLRCIGFGVLVGALFAGFFAFGYIVWQPDESKAMTLLLGKAVCDPSGDINVRIPSGGEFNCFTPVTKQRVFRRPARKTKHKRKS